MTTRRCLTSWGRERAEVALMTQKLSNQTFDFVFQKRVKINTVLLNCSSPDVCSEPRQHLTFNLLTSHKVQDVNPFMEEETVVSVQTAAFSLSLSDSAFICQCLSLIPVCIFSHILYQRNKMHTSLIAAGQSNITIIQETVTESVTCRKHNMSNKKKEN